MTPASTTRRAISSRRCELRLATTNRSWLSWIRIRTRTELLLDSADLTLAYNEEPHRDAYERGLEAAGRFFEVLSGEIKPVAARERAPMLLPAINMASDEGPMVGLHQLRQELEATPGVLDISIHMGFYGTNSPSQGFSVVCTTDDDRQLASGMARQVAAAAWQKRREFIVDLGANRRRGGGCAGGGRTGGLDRRSG